MPRAVLSPAQTFTPGFPILLAALCGPVLAADPFDSLEEVLPPTLPWDGRSRELMVPANDPWATPSEKSGLAETPRYDETFSWLGRLVEAADELELVSIGKSLEGRDIWMVVASRSGFTPEAIRASGKPVLLAHGSIHAGEIDGKDAGLMLLRDMTVGGRNSEFLDNAVWLFIPILNVDGHERFSRYGRSNQRGPREMGWRTNRRNLNLNRDFSKLDTEEVQALVGTINTWQPDLYFDLHVTDGVDYQYDITWGYNGQHSWSPRIARWLDEHLTPAITAELEAWGHIPGPLIFADNDRDMTSGNVYWTSNPRYSTGYGDARHLASVLVENHSLKPYEQRVLGTYVLLAATLDVLGRKYRPLRKATRADRQARPAERVLAWKTRETLEPEILDLKGIESELVFSPVMGTDVVRWTGKPLNHQVPLRSRTSPAATAARPDAYYIPASWRHIATRLQLHGVEVERLDESRTVTAEMYRLNQADLAAGSDPETPNVYEGHVRVSPGEVEIETRELNLAPGSYRVSTDQPLGTLVMLLLEPESPDSYFQWGFMLEILHRTEYAEAYVMEPLARRMLAADPELARAFQERLDADSEFATDPDARLQWFYERTPFWDQEYRLYPIGRSVSRRR